MKLLSFLGLFFLFSTCRHKTLSSHKSEFHNLTTDSLLFQSLSEKTKVLNLNTINNGVDSFELRIWHGFAISTPVWLVILKYQDSCWQLTRTNYWLHRQWVNGSPTKVLLDSSFTRTLKVPSNISSLADSIYKFRLDTLPSQSEIPNFRDRVDDGVFYQIEMAKPNFYKAIHYNNPSFYNDRFNQGITRLVTMLKDIGVFSI